MGFSTGSKQKLVVHSYDGPADGERFLSFLDKLLPGLTARDVVIMDNCRIHHIEAVFEKLATVGARPLFLPPYSPEVEALNYAKSPVTFENIDAYFNHADSFLGLAQPI